MTRTAPVAVAVAAVALLAACSTPVVGEATANPAAAAAHRECARNVNDAVGSVKTFFAGVEAFTGQPIDAAPLRGMRDACDAEFVTAYSDFLVRIRREYTPSTVMGRIGQNQFMNGLCRNDTAVGVKVDELTVAAQEACRGT